MQRDGPAQIPRRLAGAGEVAAGGQRVRVVLAQHPDETSERLLVQRDGPAQLTRRLVGAGEVVAGGQRGRVVLA